MTETESPRMSRRFSLFERDPERAFELLALRVGKLERLAGRHAAAVMPFAEDPSVAFRAIARRVRKLETKTHRSVIRHRSPKRK